MRFITIALFLVAATLCFVAGYKVGKESPRPPTAVAEIIEEEAPIQPLTDTVKLPQIAVELPNAEPIPNPFALRAEETVQTFFDKNERKLVAEILEVRADSLKVKRQSDGYKFELPVAMLSSEDQAFAAYLWEQQSKESSPAPSSQSMEDKIWDELFK